MEAHYIGLFHPSTIWVRPIFTEIGPKKPQKADFAMKQTNIGRLSGDIMNAAHVLLPVLLHWLPVSRLKRTQFKVALLDFDCVRGMGPTYFTRVCVPVPDNTAVFVLLNAATCSFLERGRSWEQSFRVAAPVWNLLPTELRSISVSRDTFKSRLKSHFYADAVTPIFIKSENVRV